ncbi:MAG: hypothetical protein CMJ83_14285 [Planctomycetes bacterium]|nr:hypothetical protein [Planctomycetota bacterium]
MNDALRKAAEERDRKRRQKARPPADSPGSAPGAPVAEEASPAETVSVDAEPEAPRAEPPIAETVRADVSEAAPPETEQPKVREAEPTPREPKARRSKKSRPKQPETTSPREVVFEESAEDAPATAPDSGGTGSRARRAREKILADERRREREAEAAVETSLHVDQRVVTYHEPRDGRAEQIRGIRTSLLSLDPAPNSVVITSGSPNEGKSLACVNLAAALVEGGRRRVLLVDANLRYPQLPDLCGGTSGLGLSDLMNGAISDPKDAIIPTGIPGVELLPAGESLDNPGSLLNPKALSGVLELVEDRFDFVIVDTPALDEYADAAVMAPEADGAILIVQVAGPPRAQAEKALDLLESARARVLGVVAMNCRV